MSGKTSANRPTGKTSAKQKKGTLDMSRKPRPAKQPMGQQKQSHKSKPARLTPNQLEQVTREVEKEVPDILTALLSGKKPVKTKTVKLTGQHGGKYPVKMVIR